MPRADHPQHRPLCLLSVSLFVLGAAHAQPRAVPSDEMPALAETVTRGLEYRDDALGTVYVEGTVRRYNGERSLERLRRPTGSEERESDAMPEHTEASERTQVLFRMRLGPALAEWWVELMGAGAPGNLLLGPHASDGTGDIQRAISFSDGQQVYEYSAAGGRAQAYPYDPARCPEYASHLIQHGLGGRVLADTVRRLRLSGVAWDSLQGDECCRLSVESPPADGVVPGRLTIWLTPDRSFIPLRLEYESPKPPGASAQVFFVETRSDLKQLDGGLWVPTRYEKQVFTHADTGYLWEWTTVYELSVAEALSGQRALHGRDWLLTLPIGTEVWHYLASDPEYIVGDLSKLAEQFARQSVPPLERD